MEGNRLPIIEILPENVKAVVENLEESKYPIEITPDKSDLIEITSEYDEDEMNIKPEFQIHVAVNDENITDTVPETDSLTP